MVADTPSSSPDEHLPTPFQPSSKDPFPNTVPKIGSLPSLLFWYRGRQDRVDRGLEAGSSSAERAELTAAKQRIRELEAEVEIHRRASELLAERTCGCRELVSWRDLGVRASV